MISSTTRGDFAGQHIKTTTVHVKRGLPLRLGINFDFTASIANRVIDDLLPLTAIFRALSTRQAVETRSIHVCRLLESLFDMEKGDRLRPTA